MKYIFETDEQEEAEVLFNAFAVKSALWDFSSWLRDAVKYDTAGMDFKTLEAVRKELYDNFKDFSDDYIR